MNAERLHAVARRIRDDLAESDLPGVLQRLVEGLQNMANAPQEPSYQSTVSELRSELTQLLARSVINDFSPVERQVVREWGVDDLLGTELLTKVNQIFNENQITIQTAQEQVAELVAPVQALKDRLDQLIAALDGLGIGAEELQPAEFEIDILVPRAAVRNELGALGVELKELENILLPLIELSTGSRPGVEIRSVGSSDFTLFLAAAPGAAVCIAKAVDTVLTLYERILNIRRVKADLESLELDDGAETIEQASRPLEAYANSAMERGTTGLAKALVEEYASQRLPEGRVNELEISVTRSLRGIAGRIDDGYNISVRVGVLDAADEEADDAQTEDQVPPELREQVRLVEERARAFEFMNLSGRRILSLEDPESEPDSDSDSGRVASTDGT